MAIYKMPITYKNNRNKQIRRIRRYKRKVATTFKRNPKTARVASLVAKRVVSKALGRNLESKTRTVQFATLVMRGSTVYGINPTYFVPQSTTEADRIGDRIQNVRFRLHATYHHRGVSTLNNAVYSSARFRIVGAWINTKWSTGTEGFWDDLLFGGTGTNPAVTDLYKLNPGLSGCYDTMFLNFNKITPVFDKVYTVKRQTTDAGDSSIPVPVNIDIKMGTLQYGAQSSPQFLKNNQFIVFIVAAGLNTESVIPITSDYMGYFRCCSMLTWRDA